MWISHAGRSLLAFFLRWPDRVLAVLQSVNLVSFVVQMQAIRHDCKAATLNALINTLKLAEFRRVSNVTPARMVSYNERELVHFLQ